MPLSPEEQNEYDLQVSRLEDQKIAEEEAQGTEKNQKTLDELKKILKIAIIGDVIDFFTVGTIGWVTGWFIDGWIYIKLSKLGLASKHKGGLWTSIIIEKIPVLDALFPRSLYIYLGIYKKTKDELESKQV